MTTPANTPTPQQSPDQAMENRPLRVYVASSWRNTFQPDVVKILRSDGHEVYDFKDSDGFHWTEVDPDWLQWPSNVEKYLRGLNHSCAERGFNRDMMALRNCDVCVYVMPCGVSASLEAGWAAGAGKRTIVYVPGLREPDLMVKMADLVTDDLEAVREAVKSAALSPADAKPTQTQQLLKGCSNWIGNAEHARYCGLTPCTCGRNKLLDALHAVRTWDTVDPVTGEIVPPPTQPQLQAEREAREVVSQIRGMGWSVAVHNDYRLQGEAYTFWGFTKGSMWVRGEGRTDDEALASVLSQILDAAPSPKGDEEAVGEQPVRPEVRLYREGSYVYAVRAREDVWYRLPSDKNWVRGGESFNSHFEYEEEYPDGHQLSSAEQSAFLEKHPLPAEFWGEASPAPKCK